MLTVNKPLLDCLSETNGLELNEIYDYFNHSTAAMRIEGSDDKEIIKRYEFIAANCMMLINTTKFK